jgi:16S rRNA (adenine1518-N6/adenine1519-N6)-dimethyltransferase
LKAVVDSDRLIQMLQELNINPQARAEDLSVTQWVDLSNNLEARGETENALL